MEVRPTGASGHGTSITFTHQSLTSCRCLQVPTSSRVSSHSSIDLGRVLGTKGFLWISLYFAKCGTKDDQKDGIQG